MHYTTSNFLVNSYFALNIDIIKVKVTQIIRRAGVFHTLVVIYHILTKWTYPTLPLLLLINHVFVHQVQIFVFHTGLCFLLELLNLFLGLLSWIFWLSGPTLRHDLFSCFLNHKVFRVKWINLACLKSVIKRPISRSYWC